MTSKLLNKYRIPSTRLQNWDYTSNAAYFITICTQNRARYFGNIKEGIMYLSEIGQLAEEYWREIPNHFPFVELGNFVIMPNHMHGILIINHPVDSVLEPKTPVETLHCNVSHLNNPQPKINVKTLHCNVSHLNNPQPKINVKTLHCNDSLSNNNHANNYENNETLQCNDSLSNNNHTNNHENNETLQCNDSLSNNNHTNNHENNETLQCNDSLSNNNHTNNHENNETLQCNDSLSNNNHANNHENNETLQCNVSTGNQTMSTISPKRGSIATIIRSYKSIVTRTARNIYPDFAWQSRYYDRIIKNATAFENIQNYIQENPKNWKKDDFYL